MLVRDPETEELERLDVIEQRNWVKQREDNAYNHELNMKQLEVDRDKTLKELEVKQASLINKTKQHSETRKAIVLAIVKLPLLPIALLAILILQLFNKEVPESLDLFIEL